MNLLTHDHNFRQRYPVLWFVLGSSLLLLLLLGGLAHEQGWFTRTINLQFQAASANELRPGLQVRLSGVPIGKVSAVQLDELAQVQVTLQIAADYQRFLTDGTRAVKARDGLFGDSYIELRPGRGGNKLAENAVLPFDDDPGLNGVVMQLRDRLLPVLDNLQLFTSRLNDPAGDWQQLASETRQLLQELRQSRQQLDRMLRNVDQLAGKTVPRTLQQADASLASIRALAEQTEQRFAAISERLNASLQQLEQGGQAAEQTLQSLQQWVEEARPQLATVLKDTEVLLKNANQTVDNMQTHWPFTPDDEVKKPEPAREPGLESKTEPEK